MDPNTGRPPAGGGNPYLQPPQPKTPAAGGQMDAGMAPIDPASLGGGGTSETTKPRQMPAGSAPDPMMGGDMPLGPGGAGAPTPLGPPAGSNTPQPTRPPVTSRMRVQAIRRDILASNPDVPVEHAHAIALSVVAFQAQAASPMGPAPSYSQQQRIIDPSHAGNQGGQGGHMGDLNDPTNPYSPLHPNHPLYRQYGGSPGIHADPMGKPGDFQTQFGGRNRLEDHAYSKGYRGKTPHLYAATDLLANHLVDKARTWHQTRKQAPATKAGKPGAPGARVMP